jgi:acyl-CoA reductase-like NAD-dependent aldehyde dehydrogenase
LNIVTGVGAEAGAALVRHPDVAKISFTGSTAVGKGIVAASAGDLRRVTLELGGKSPVFVFDDADMDVTIPACAAGIFSNSGQMCLAGSRLFVQKKSFDRVISGIADIARKSRIGNGLDPTVDLGPLISRRQRDRVMGYIESGQSEGAELVTGGHAVGDAGYFVEPTVFVTTNRKARIAVEEIFGPVLTATPFDDPAEVVALGNATRYGLAAGVYTRDIGKAHRTASAMQAGTVWINCYGLLDTSMPFGGYKESGWGREGGFDGIEAFQEHKSVYAIPMAGSSSSNAAGSSPSASIVRRSATASRQRCLPNWQRLAPGWRNPTTASSV